MQLGLLLTADVPKPPADIKVLHNFGKIQVISDVGSETDFGDHVIVEGSVESIRLWLAPLRGIWKQKDGPAPQMQIFEIVHVKD